LQTLDGHHLLPKNTNVFRVPPSSKNLSPSIHQERRNKNKQKPSPKSDTQEAATAPFQTTEEAWHAVSSDASKRGIKATINTIEASQNKIQHQVQKKKKKPSSFFCLCLCVCVCVCVSLSLSLSLSLFQGVKLAIAATLTKSMCMKEKEMKKMDKLHSKHRMWRAHL
jgi:Flp pilus assembly protein TadB